MVDPDSNGKATHGCPWGSPMAIVQKTLLDFYDIPCALITHIDGKAKSPPIRMTKDDLEFLLRRNRDEWDSLTVHFLDGAGVPLPSGPMNLERETLPLNNHFLI